MSRYFVYNNNDLVNTIEINDQEVIKYEEATNLRLVKDETAIVIVDNTKQILSLKSQLSATDYKIIKCSESQLAGLEAPYDIAVLHAERQALRNEINLLEAEQNSLK